MGLAKRPWGISIIAFLCFVLLPGLVFTARQGTPRGNGPASNGWDREGAARYLDERMEVWFAKAKKLRTGQTETACVSCHTTIPYVLARPSLRRAMQVNAATSQELRLIEE